MTLTVQDDDGAPGTATEVVDVTAPQNQAPAASFTYGCSDLACDFTDTSTDGDGAIVTWSWAFGDGNVSTSQNPSHTYAAAGTYTVTLTVTDDDGATDVAVQTVTASAPPVEIVLTAVGYKVRGLQKADLTWTGVTSGDVDVYRDGALIMTTANDGSETDPIDARGSGSYAYRVCEAGTSTCSGTVTVTF